jgi:hypothetical protein
MPPSLREKIRKSEVALVTCSFPITLLWPGLTASVTYSPDGAMLDIYWGYN